MFLLREGRNYDVRPQHSTQFLYPRLFVHSLWHVFVHSLIYVLAIIQSSKSVLYINQCKFLKTLMVQGKLIYAQTDLVLDNLPARFLWVLPLVLFSAKNHCHGLRVYTDRWDIEGL